METTRHHVVVIGSGFGGLFTAKALRRADVDVTLISRTTHHLFQPLLYQVATGILSEGEVAPATREILRKQRNARVVLGEVTGLDLTRRTVTSVLDGRPTVTAYDSLVLAAGVGTTYFGNEGFEEHAPGLKSVADAMELRSRIFGAFERAEVAETTEERQRLMTFVVVGAGPTGVELTGQISELARRTLRTDFRTIDPATARVVLVDAADAVLGSFGEKLGAAAQSRLEKMGVDVRLATQVVDVDAEGLVLRHGDGPAYRIESSCKAWAAGVAASSLTRLLETQAAVELDRSGRVLVNPDLTVPGHPEVFVIGDLIGLDGVPGVAQTAIQSARYSARMIKRRAAGHEPSDRPFRYRDKGSMAAISRSSAVANVFGWKFSGFIAWLMWLALHLVYVVGFRSRFTALVHWLVSFVGRGRSERTAVERWSPAEGDVAGWEPWSSASSPNPSRARPMTTSSR